MSKSNVRWEVGCLAKNTVGQKLNLSELKYEFLDTTLSLKTKFKLFSLFKLKIFYFIPSHILYSWHAWFTYIKNF